MSGSFNSINGSTLPSDPFMLLSMINMKLRDSGDNLDELCDELGFEKSEILDILEKAGFEYLPEINQFR